MLGLRHGFDADHLATIDGLTRYSARSNPRVAGLAGVLFAIGHGLVVLLIALAAGTLAAGWQMPGWLEVVGATVSIMFLFGLAYANVHAVLTTPPDIVVAHSGLKARLISRMLSVKRPLAIAAVGMLFAVSFDTISQVALLSLAAGRFGGLARALVVAGLFGLGMLMVDGINGMWITALIRRADRTAAIASRIMALAVAAISVVVGLYTIAKLLLPPVNAWGQAHGIVSGGAVVTGAIAAFIASMVAALAFGRRQTRRPSSDTADAV